MSFLEVLSYLETVVLRVGALVALIIFVVKVILNEFQR